MVSGTTWGTRRGSLNLLNKEINLLYGWQYSSRQIIETFTPTRSIEFNPRSAEGYVCPILILGSVIVFMLL